MINEQGQEKVLIAKRLCGSIQRGLKRREVREARRRASVSEELVYWVWETEQGWTTRSFNDNQTSRDEKHFT